MAKFIAPGAVVLGNVELGENASIWYNAVVRADDEKICIGENSNIQDNCTLHVECGQGIKIGDNVTVGHNAVVHACEIQDNTLIGMGAIVLSGAVVGKNCIIGAGCLIAENAIIPDNSLVVGIPGKIKREVSLEEELQIKQNALHYVESAKKMGDCNKFCVN